MASSVGATLAKRSMTSAGSTGTKRINTKVRMETPNQTKGNVKILFKQNIHVDSYMLSLPTQSYDKERAVSARHTLSSTFIFL